MEVNCKICGYQSRLFLRSKALNKYNTELFQCEKCKFIQVISPSWLNEAYTSAISSMDTGLVSRNMNLARLSTKIIKRYFNYSKKFIDYGGGYGLFVRLMRDKGFDFYRQDLYCENLFSQYFDINDLEDDNKKFELLTAFEVFEHLENPITEIEKMLKLSDSVLFSTELQPKNISDKKDWWYFSLESGQHISFYTKESLRIIARKFNLNFYTDNKSLHLLTTKTISSIVFQKFRTRCIHSFTGKLIRLISLVKDSTGESPVLESLTKKDSDFIKTRI